MVTGEKATKEPFDFWGGISGAFASVPEKLLGVLDTFTDPLKLSIGDISDATTAAEEQKVSASTFGSMVTLFGSQSAAFAYLLFILLYFPCSAAISAVYRETNLAWTAFAGLWTTFLAYLTSTLFYQAVNFLAHPGYSLLVIAADLCAFSCVILILNSIGKANQRSNATVAIAEKIQPGFAGKR